MKKPNQGWRLNWLLNFLSLFSSDMKGMRPFIGAHIKADTKATNDVFQWEAIDFKKTVLDTAESISSKASYLKRGKNHPLSKINLRLIKKSLEGILCLYELQK